MSVSGCLPALRILDHCEPIERAHSPNGGYGVVTEI